MPRAARYWEVAAESWVAPAAPAVESESAAGVSDAAARRGSSVADEMRQRPDEAKVSKRRLGARPSGRAVRAGGPENPSRGHTTSTPFAEQRFGLCWRDVPDGRRKQDEKRLAGQRNHKRDSGRPLLDPAIPKVRIAKEFFRRNRSAKQDQNAGEELFATANT